MKMLKNSLFVSVFRKRKSQKMEKTTKKTVFHGTYSIVDSKQGKCPYGGNAGYIKYLYLGLKNRVKNWFRNKTICNKCLHIGLRKITGSQMA